MVQVNFIQDVCFDEPYGTGWFAIVQAGKSFE
jgi:hypothetical protein